MDHNEASLLIPDLAANRLDGDRASAVEGHVTGCAECRGALALHRRIRDEIASLGESLFTEHPSSDEIVDFAIASSRLQKATRDRLRSHVEACPTCRVEAASVRGADAYARGWWQGIADFIGRGFPLPAPALVPALMVLLFIYPAYLGLVRLPEVSRECEHAQQEVEALRQAGTWEGGPVASLTLLSIPRGGEPPPSSPIPTVRLRPGQAFQLMRIQVEPSTWSPSSVVVVAVRPSASPEASWEYRAPFSELWDAADEAINLLWPVDHVGAGDYVLEIRGQDSTVPDYSASFRTVR